MASMFELHSICRGHAVCKVQLLPWQGPHPGLELVLHCCSAQQGESILNELRGSVQLGLPVAVQAGARGSVLALPGLSTRSLRACGTPAPACADRPPHSGSGGLWWRLRGRAQLGLAGDK